MTMNKKIIFWLDSNLTYFCLAHFLQKELDADFYAIIDVTNKTRSFYENQNLVNFKKVWFLHDHILPLRKPDLEYLSLFEKTYNIELWKLAINDRIFNHYNDFYNFTRNEILSILQNESKLFESVLHEINPDYVIMHEPYQLPDELFFELAKSLQISVLASFKSHLGYKSEIAENIHYADNISNMKNKSTYRSFDELKNYNESFNLSNKIKKQNIDPFGNNTDIFNAAIDYIFKTSDDNTETHYTYFGHSKIKTVLNAISNSLKTRRRWKYLDKHLVKKPDLRKKFIYYPLHIEQERSTLIVTPFFTDDIEFIEIIAKSIPIDYHLYVKEHPSQITRHWRDKKFYQKLNRIPNVTTIHPNTSSLELVKNCAMVITRSGTVALEAAFYQKSAITCADFDFILLPSIERLMRVEELPKLISKCLEKKMDPKILDQYVSFKEENTSEFDISDFDTRIVNRFFHGGRFVDVIITNEKMLEFLNENEDSLKGFTKAYLEKIKFFKEENNS